MLLDPRKLEQSAVVANCAMNRERELYGGNGYERDLGLDVLMFLRRPVHRAEAGKVKWADLCCGSG